MKEWTFKPLSKGSWVSGTDFEKGEAVLSFLFRSEDAIVERADIKQGETTSFKAPGPVIGHWSQQIPKKDPKGLAQRKALNSAEALFLSLYADTNDTLQVEEISEEECAILKHLLALMLERKRILRPLRSEANSEGQRFLHIPSKKEYLVPAVALTKEAVARVMGRLQDLVYTAQ